MKKICRRCIIHRINIKSRKMRKSYLTKILHYFRENGYYEAPAQGQDGPAIEVSTAGGFRGRQASSASRVAIATGQEKSITSAKEGHATVKESFATYEEDFRDTKLHTHR